MKTIVTLAAMAGAALALSACSGETAKAPEEAAATEAAPAATEAAPTDEAAAAAEGLDPTGNPIGMDQPVAADGEAPAVE